MLKVKCNDLEIDINKGILNEVITDDTLSPLYRKGNTGLLLELDENGFFMNMTVKADKASLTDGKFSIIVGEKPDESCAIFDLKNAALECGMVLTYKLDEDDYTKLKEFTLSRNLFFASTKHKTVSLRSNGVPIRNTLSNETRIGQNTYYFYDDEMSVIVEYCKSINKVTAWGRFIFLGLKVGEPINKKEIIEHPMYENGRLMVEETPVLLCLNSITSDIAVINNITILYEGE